MRSLMHRLITDLDDVHIQHRTAQLYFGDTYTTSQVPRAPGGGRGRLFPLLLIVWIGELAGGVILDW